MSQVCQLVRLTRGSAGGVALRLQSTRPVAAVAELVGRPKNFQDTEGFFSQNRFCTTRKPRIGIHRKFRKPSTSFFLLSTTWRSSAALLDNSTANSAAPLYFCTVLLQNKEYASLFWRKSA